MVSTSCLSRYQMHQQTKFPCAEVKASQEPHPSEAVPRQKASSKIGPAATRLMEEHDLKPEDITPTGPQGIITKGDVLQAVAGGVRERQASAEKQPQPRSSPQPRTVEGESQSKGSPPSGQKQHSDRQLEASKAGPAKASQQPGEGRAGGRKGKGLHYTDTPNSQIRKIIAQRLLESKQQIPSLYVTATADVDAVSALRQSLKNQGQKVIAAGCIITFCLQICTLHHSVCKIQQQAESAGNALALA